MSLNIEPGSSHLCKASDLLRCLPERFHGAYEYALANDLERAVECYNENRNRMFPEVSEFIMFRPGDEISDDLEVGIVYALFSEGDLYVKIKTKPLIEMETLGVIPKFQKYVIFV